MRIDPAIGALVADPAPVAGAGTAAQAWREVPEVIALLAELARFGAEAALGTCPKLAALVTNPDRGGQFARGVAQAAVGGVCGAPLAVWPWRHFSNGVLHSVTLAASGRASLSLALIDAGAWHAARDPAAPQLASFQPGELHAAVVSGSGEGRILRLDSTDGAIARIAAEPIAFREGAGYALDGARQALAIDAIEGHLLTLRLHRHGDGTAPARQFDLADGRLVHQAAADQRDSRSEMAVALLRAMDRTDAAPVVARLARQGSPAARWQALRECLALDSAQGFRVLLDIAGDPADPLKTAARALAERLSAQDPAFAHAREALTCPA